MNTTANSVISFLPTACQIAQSIPTTERAAFWFVVGLMGFWGLFTVIIAFIVWGTAELTLRFGSSSNGCTPAFNSAVGSMTFVVLQAILYFLFTLLFGNWIYCTYIPGLSYLLVFPAVKVFLIAIGFWDH